MIPNKEFKDELKALAIPFIISNILANSFTFIDTLMIGNLGEKAIAAMSIAGQFSFILGLLLSSVYGMTIYLVQFYGAGDWGNFRKTQGIMLFSGILVSIFIFFVIFLFKYSLVELFTRDQSYCNGCGLSNHYFICVHHQCDLRTRTYSHYRQ